MKRGHRGYGPQASEGEVQSKAIDIDNDLHGTLRNFGLKVGVVGAAKFEARIKHLMENLPDLAFLIESLLVVHRVLREQIAVLYRCLLRDDEVCRRLISRSCSSVSSKPGSDLLPQVLLLRLFARWRIGHQPGPNRRK